MAHSIVKQKSYDFTLKTVRFCSQLREDKHLELASQLLRSGTSIGANVEEALTGQSRKDFLAKMCIASKEARETRYWLRLVKDARIVDGQESQRLIKLSEELIRILTSIVKTCIDKGSDVRGKNLELKT